MSAGDGSGTPWEKWKYRLWISDRFVSERGNRSNYIFHDHHNLFVAGNDPEDMLFAIQRIGELQGGFLTVKDGQILSELALPVCGILSEASIEATGSALKEVRESLITLGYEHHNPIMSVGTLGLPVSPALKLTDHGLIDVKEEKSCLWCYPVLDFLQDLLYTVS